MSTQEPEQEPVLPEDVPVAMPELPLQRRVHTAQQFKALGDPLRSRILGIIQHQPATAKQIAARLGIAPGTVGHHLQVLEAAGLAQVVARRLVHGIVAKYYTRTARVFLFDFPPEIAPDDTYLLDFLTHARSDLSESLASGGRDVLVKASYPRARLSAERAQYYQQRVEALSEEFLSEPIDPDGEVYALSLALFKAPPYQQSAPFAEAEVSLSTQETDSSQEEKRHNA